MIHLGIQVFVARSRRAECVGGRRRTPFKTLSVLTPSWRSCAKTTATIEKLFSGASMAESAATLRSESPRYCFSSAHERSRRQASFGWTPAIGLAKTEAVLCAEGQNALSCNRVPLPVTRDDRHALVARKAAQPIETSGRTVLLEGRLCHSPGFSG